MAASKQSSLIGLPKAYYAVLFIEFWERFAFYGLQSVAVFYFIKKFNLSEGDASNLFAAFSALLYVLLTLGGIIGDKILGLRRTYLLGVIFLFLGYFSLGFFSQVQYLYFGMGIVLVGNVLFKTNATNYVGRCFDANDPRVDSAFTYFYMLINMGSLISKFLVPILAQYTSYGTGILICALGMIVAFISYLIFKQSFADFDNEVGKRGHHQNRKMWLISALSLAASFILGKLLGNVELSTILLYSIAVVTILVYIGITFKVSKVEARGMLIALILIGQAIIFYLLYIQQATSIMLFAKHNMRLDFGGIHIPPGITQAFNPFFIIILSPILANVYMRFYHNGREISIPFKFALGTLVTGVCFLFLALGCRFPDANGQISLIWCFIAYGFYSLGELLVSAIGSAMVAKLLPSRLGGFAQGMWFLSSAIGMRLGGQVSAYAAVKSDTTLTSFQILAEYQSLFIKLGILTVVIGILLFVFVKYLDKSIKYVLANKVSALADVS